jgi:hypothetical protein
MSTVRLGDRYETRLRRRPRDTSSSAATVRLPFIRRGAVLTVQKLPISCRRPLPIPKHVHGYNCFMNGSDIADQLRAWFKTQRKTNRPWWPLFYFLLDHSIINAYLLHNWHTKEAGNPSKLKSHHLRFRSDLADALLSGLQPRDLPIYVNNRHGEIRPQTKLPLHLHTHTKIPGDRQATCYWCRLQERQA